MSLSNGGWALEAGPGSTDCRGPHEWRQISKKSSQHGVVGAVLGVIPGEVIAVWQAGRGLDLAGGRVKEDFLKEVELKPRQKISRHLAGGRRKGSVFQEGDEGTACAKSQRQQTTCCLWKVENSSEWLVLRVGSGGTGVRQAARALGHTGASQ